jgi:hypothetical protein
VLVASGADDVMTTRTGKFGYSLERVPSRLNCFLELIGGNSMSNSFIMALRLRDVVVESIMHVQRCDDSPRTNMFKTESR